MKKLTVKQLRIAIARSGFNLVYYKDKPEKPYLVSKTERLTPLERYVR